jgi:hypothetical protein
VSIDQLVGRFGQSKSLMVVGSAGELNILGEEEGEKETNEGCTVIDRERQRGGGGSRKLKRRNGDVITA